MVLFSRDKFAAAIRQSWGRERQRLAHTQAAPAVPAAGLDQLGINYCSKLQQKLAHRCLVCSLQQGTKMSVTSPRAFTAQEKLIGVWSCLWHRVTRTNKHLV